MALTIWRFTDGKAGHDSQSLGLCHALNRKSGAVHFDISIKHCRNNLINLLSKRFPYGKDLPKPDMVIGAGHATHMPMITAARHHVCQSIVLMKPSLPVGLFNYCLIPEHDNPSKRNNIIPTKGALNDIQANTEKDSNLLLILLGGKSRHVKWDHTFIINQINQIIEKSDDKNVILIGSPRTPEKFFDDINIKNRTNIIIYRHQDLPRDQLLNHMSKAAIIWVSIDSISMIYEALSTGAKTGLISLMATNDSKILKNAKQLVLQELAISFDEWLGQGKYYDGVNLKEADRCAELILKNLC